MAVNKMAEYIEREELKKQINAIHNAVDTSSINPDYDAGFHSATSLIQGLISYIPASNVAEERCGKWIDKCVRDWHCSECNCEIQKIRHVDGYCYDDLPNYCPNCGAPMTDEAVEMVIERLEELQHDR